MLLARQFPSTHAFAWGFELLEQYRAEVETLSAPSISLFLRPQIIIRDVKL